MLTIRLLAAASVLIGSSVLAQAPGLRLFSPLGLSQTQLIDGQGTIVHTWPDLLTVSAHMEADGTLIRGMVAPGLTLPGTTGRLQRMNFNGTIAWDLIVHDATRWMHHDIEPMPNGNVLVIVADRDTPVDAIASGRDPSLVSGTDWFPESIIEIQQTGPTTGQVVWEWHQRDHVIQDFDNTKPNFGVVGSHPELLDINFPAQNVSNGDWNHANGITYDPINDWVMISYRTQSEVYLIDHSTTSAEAATHVGGARGKGGDFLWRWGNPQSYDVPNAVQRLALQHDPCFIRAGYPGEGNITIFNNDAVPGMMSSVIELQLPLDVAGSPYVDPVSGKFGPDRAHWRFGESGFYSAFVSGAQRMKNGNTLVCSGQQGYLFEVTDCGQTVWSYQVPGGSFVFQAKNIERRLWTDVKEIPIIGGPINFYHVFDTSLAGNNYLLLGSVTGSAPGVPLALGVVLPLNIDTLFNAMLVLPNSPSFVNTLGVVDVTGRADSTVIVPQGELFPALIGWELNFAHVVFDSFGVPIEVSQPTIVTVVQ
ncbi:MAG: hypothetical protein ACI89X_002719 [Planctomycetota bacterium]|jgi:hypothetical protein